MLVFFVAVGAREVAVMFAKHAAVLLVVAGCCVGMTAESVLVPDRKPHAPPAEASAPMVGKWRQIYAEFEGVEQKAEYAYQNCWIITDQTITITTRTNLNRGDNRGSWRYELNAATTPAAIDLHVIAGQKQCYPSIIKVEGDRLTVCIQNFPERGRPREFTTTAGSGIGKYVYVRIKPNE
jgi:uncharacterized protein (TIGR03067 family)